MVTVSESIFIKDSTEKVFRVVEDPEQQVVWDKNNFRDPVAINDSKPGLGARYSCIVTGMGKMTYEFSEYHPYTYFVHTSQTSIVLGKHIFRFQQKETGTDFLQTMILRPRGWGYLLYPFLKMMTRSRLKKMNKNLKQYIEQH